ncbi:MAG: bifunctional DNA primase/polymerase [Methanoregula sp.]|nr:bifunctional DNA primase/polymerase [Methanoregula sp.]
MTAINFSGIPSQLSHGRFIKLRRKSKEACESGWKTTSNYPADDSELLDYIKYAGNYGVLSRSGICQMDIDDPVKFKNTGIKLPASFTVTRGKSKRGHYYFTSTDCPPEYRDKFVLTFGDVRLGGNFYVVGPGSRHPSGDLYRINTDLPLADVPFAVVWDIITRFGIAQKIPPSRPQQAYSAGSSWGDLLGLRCEGIAPPDNAVTYGSVIRGSNPFHGSETGNNFHIDTVKQVWFCHRHSTGGGPLELYTINIVLSNVRMPGRGASMVTGMRSLLH